MGYGVDLSAEGDGANAALQKAMENNGLQSVDYGRFIHVHNAGSTRFALDKAMFEELRAALFEADDLTSFEAINTCILYDLPDLSKVTLVKASSGYVVEGITGNGQEWTVKFSGISPDGYLIDKEIAASRAAARP